jgi:hypothetical protein
MRVVPSKRAKRGASVMRASKWRGVPLAVSRATRIGRPDRSVLISKGSSRSISNVRAPVRRVVPKPSSGMYENALVSVREAVPLSVTICWPPLVTRATAFMVRVKPATVALRSPSAVSRLPSSSPTSTVVGPSTGAESLAHPNIGAAQAIAARKVGMSITRMPG